MTLDHEAARDSKPLTAVDAKDAEVRENTNTCLAEFAVLTSAAVEQSLTVLGVY